MKSLMLNFLFLVESKGGSSSKLSVPTKAPEIVTKHRLVGSKNNDDPVHKQAWIDVDLP